MSAPSSQELDADDGALPPARSRSRTMPGSRVVRSELGLDELLSTL